MSEVIDIEVERDARKLQDVEDWVRTNLTPHALDRAAEQYSTQRLEDMRVGCEAIMRRVREQI